ncbi:glycosyltransferase [Methylicorpusculum sp.]|uniref:glycosyltransferase n=1 Tax=Methylicorpusculum sp. TaxID=2713644 RepID=UPI002727C2BF|nr:glycosyltransferase [Methylicorpusculum sp.]MDO8843292.1 glycosyltransferase [Methylicorpusculum sp.]
MKIGIVNKHHKKGGAAIAADRLFEALLSDGVTVYKYIDSGEIDNPNIKKRLFGVRFSEFISFIRNSIGTGFAKMVKRNDSTTLSPAVIPSCWPDVLNDSDMDVINLHWINGEMMSIKDISRITKPLVWTMHDMWLVSGASHYFDEKELELNSSDGRASNKQFDLEMWTLSRKLKLWKKPIHIVSPSNWLARCVKKSKLTSNWPVSVIHNPIDINFWKPLSKSRCRQHLGLSADEDVLMFGAVGGGKDPRKGFDLLIDAIERLHQNYSAIKNLTVVVVGQVKPTKDVHWQIPTIFTGHLSSQDELRDFYNAADLLVIPSRQDNLPNTGLEAIACGVPVVAFDIGGLSDIVVHKKTGYLASAFDCSDLAAGIVWVLEQKKLNNESVSRESEVESININCRIYAEENFSYQVIAEKYKALYRSLL